MIFIKVEFHFFHHETHSPLSVATVTPVVMTALVLFLILIPAGYIMKGLVVMSIRFTDRYENSSNMVWDKPFDINADVASSKSYPLYAPFPVCSPSSIEATSHALFASPIVYWMLFPFSDDRCWHFILCKLQHFHLGFFLLGSVNNVWFTYKILGDMFDIILGDTAEEGGVRLTRGAQLIKTGLLIYTSILVCIFWIHFNLFAFRAEATEMGTAAFRLKNFLAELPLWGLRWVTLSVAVGEFAVRSLYRWLGKALYRVEDDEILSIDEDQTAETSPSPPWRRRVITTSMWMRLIRRAYIKKNHDCPGIQIKP